MFEFKCTLGMKIFTLVGVAANPRTGLQQWHEHSMKRSVKMKQSLISSSSFTLILKQCFLGARLYSTLTQNLTLGRHSKPLGPAWFVSQNCRNREDSVCACHPPASMWTSSVCFLSHCQKMLVLNPSCLVVGLPHGFSSVWGVHESHEYSGKAPELAPLLLIKQIYRYILYPTVDT